MYFMIYFIVKFKFKFFIRQGNILLQHTLYIIYKAKQ